MSEAEMDMIHVLLLINGHKGVLNNTHCIILSTADLLSVLLLIRAHQGVIDSIHCMTARTITDVTQ
jgi:hypothetical protein